MSDWGSRIKHRRLGMGITLSELARACGISVSAVHDWESGKTDSIKGENLLQAADALNVSPEWILKGGELADEVLPAQPKSLLATIGAQIRAFRKGLPITQTELAQRVGISQSAIAGLERGSSTVALETITRIAIALGTTVEMLVNEPEIRVPKHLAGPQASTLSFGELLSKLRAARGLTQGELAERAELTQSAISAYERGGKRPTDEVFGRLAKALSTDQNELFGKEFQIDTSALNDAFASEASQSARPNRSTLHAAIQVVEEVLVDLHVTYSAKQKADLILGCYLALESGQKAASAKAVVSALLEAQSAGMSAS